MESMATISASSRGASSCPTADFPLAVGPVRNQQSSSLFIGSVLARWNVPHALVLADLPCKTAARPIRLGTKGRGIRSRHATIVARRGRRRWVPPNGSLLARAETIMRYHGLLQAGVLIVAMTTALALVAAEPRSSEPRPG